MNRKIFTLIMFAVLVFLLGARAATAQWISLPKASELGNSITSFFPVIFKNYPATTVETSPTGALYVFSTTATTNANPGGRSGMNAICSAEDINSHFCNTEELVKALTSSGVYFSDPFNKAWSDNVVSLSTWDGEYTCVGWTYSSSGQSGRTIEDQAERPGVQSCNDNLPVACCKWIP